MILEAEKGREVQTARKTVISNTEKACKVVGLSVPTYSKREQDQESFTIRELQLLYDALGADGKDTIAAWVNGKFSGETI